MGVLSGSNVSQYLCSVFHHLTPAAAHDQSLFRLENNEFLSQTQGVQISGWLLYLQSKIKQVRFRNTLQSIINDNK